MPPWSARRPETLNYCPKDTLFSQRAARIPGLLVAVKRPHLNRHSCIARRQARTNLGSATHGPALGRGTCYAAPRPIPERTRTSWRSRTTSRHESKGSWRENLVSRRSSSAEVLAPRQSTPPRSLNRSRMWRQERPALASRAGNETPFRAPTTIAKFKRRTSNPFATQMWELVCKRYRLTAAHTSKFYCE